MALPGKLGLTQELHQLNQHYKEYKYKMSITRLLPTGVNTTGSFTIGNVTVTSNVVSGNANLGNLTTSNYFSGNGSMLTSIAGANVAGQVPNALVAGTVYTSAQPNITSLGTLTSLTTGTFTSTGLTTIQGSSDVIATPKTGATGTVTHDLSTGSVFYHSDIVSDFIPNFTNVPTTNNRTNVVVLMLSQGSTPFSATSCQIDGVSQVVKTPGGSGLAPTASAFEFQTFTLIRVAGSWTVISQLSSFM